MSSRANLPPCACGCGLLIKDNRRPYLRGHRPAPPIGPRFWPRVVKGAPGECWIWVGALDRYGYGRFYKGRERTKAKAHRVSYELTRGAIPEGLTLDHLCRKRACVNPDHLEPVTLRENQRRAVAARTACPQGHLYDAENTYYKARFGTRGCRECSRIGQRRRYAGRRAA